MGRNAYFSACKYTNNLQILKYFDTFYRCGMRIRDSGEVVAGIGKGPSQSPDYPRVAGYPGAAFLVTPLKIGNFALQKDFLNN